MPNQTGMFNVPQIQARLAGMSQQQLFQEGQANQNDALMFSLVNNENMNRQKAKAALMAQQAGQQQPPVKQQDLMAMAPQPNQVPSVPTNMGAGIPLQGPGSPQQIAQNQLPEEQGIGALPANNLQRMAGGGITGENHFGGGIPREKMLEIVRDTNAQLPKPIEEMTPQEINEWMIQNSPNAKPYIPTSTLNFDSTPTGSLPRGQANANQQLNAVGDYFGNTNTSSQRNPQPQVLTPEAVANSPGITTLLGQNQPTNTQATADLNFAKNNNVDTGANNNKAPWSPPLIVAPTLKASGVPLGKAPTAESAKQQANTFLNPDAFKADFENELTETGVGVAQQRALRDNLLASRATPYKDYEARLKEQEAKEPEEKENLTGLSLLEAGLAVMGGNSPYAFQNLSRATAGVKTYSEGIKDLKKSKDLRDRAFADIEQARTAQANNDIDRSIEFEDRASGKMQEARRWSISGQQNLGLKNAEMASHNFDTANNNFFADRRANAEISARTSEANARLGLDAARMNQPPEAIRTAQYLGNGVIQTGYDMGVAKQHATELYTKWGQLAYPNGNMGQPNEAFIKRYPSPLAYVQEGLESAGFGKTGSGGFTSDLPKNATVLQAPTK